MAHQSLAPHNWFATPVGSRNEELTSTPAQWLSLYNRRVEQMCDMFFEHIPTPALDMMQKMLPQVDIQESDKEYTITTELPGLTEEDIELRTKNGFLTITSSKQGSQESKGRSGRKDDAKSDNVYSLSRAFQSFHSSLSLPVNADDAKIEAEFEDGKLVVTIPKLAADAPDKSRIALNTRGRKNASVGNPKTASGTHGR